VRKVEKSAPEKPRKDSTYLLNSNRSISKNNLYKSLTNLNNLFENANPTPAGDISRKYSSRINLTPTAENQRKNSNIFDQL
jgi:hypothetical protein